MATRLELHEKLLSLFGSKNIYYQPPENLKIEYPAIIYSRNDIDSKYANNKKYINTNLYTIIVIDRKPDNPVIEKILELPMSDYDRHYVSDNLNHDVIKLYY